MKKIISLLLVFIFALSCLTLTACSGDSNDNGGLGNKSVELTKSNFNDYFSVNFSVENCRMKYPDKSFTRSLCDLKVSIDSKTGKNPENVTVTMRFETDNSKWTIPDEKPVITTKTFTITYSGSTELSIPLETWTTYLGLETPDSSDFRYVIEDISGAVK